MVFCKLVEFLYSLIPVPGIRDIIIRRHMDGCPRCQEHLVSLAQAQSLFVKSDEIETDGDLWAKIRAGAETGRPGSEQSRPRRFFRWEWAVGAVGILFMAAVSFWFYDGVIKTGTSQNAVLSPERFEIEYINVGGAPAQAYVYQPSDTDMIFVWAEKSDQGGKP